MSQTYAARRRMEQVSSAVQNTMEQRSPAQPAAIQLDEPGRGDLEQQMQMRMQQHFLDHQIPQAEQEADRLSAGMEDARTPEEVKSRLGEKLGADFSGVRFHTGAAAVETAEGMGARAYATGRDIYFGEGGFDPGVAAHELVHTVQQGLVESATPTVSAPTGQVQMMPKLFRMIGNGLKRLFGKSPEQKEAERQADLKQYFPAIGIRNQMLEQTHDARHQQQDAAEAYARSKGLMHGEGQIGGTSGGRQFLSLFRQGDDVYNEALGKLWTPDGALNTELSEEEMRGHFQTVAAPVYQELMDLDPNSLDTSEESVQANFLRNNELVGRLNSLTDVASRIGTHLLPEIEGESLAARNTRGAAKGRELRSDVVQNMGVDPQAFNQKFAVPGMKGKQMQKAMGVQGRLDAAYLTMRENNGRNGPELGANPEYDAMVQARAAAPKKKWWQFWK